MEMPVLRFFPLWVVALALGWLAYRALVLKVLEPI